MRLSLGSRLCDSGLDALFENVTLELGKDRKYRRHCSAHRGRQVYCLRQRDKTSLNEVSS